MRLHRWNPVTDILLTGSWPRLFGDEFGRWPRSSFTALADPWWTGDSSPALEVQETDTAYVVQVDLPGADESALDVNLKDGVLSIQGERPAPDGDRHYTRRELPYGSFHHRALLPAPVDEERVEAAYVNGVLTVTLPKRAEAQPRRISVSLN